MICNSNDVCCNNVLPDNKTGIWIWIKHGHSLSGYHTYKLWYFDIRGRGELSRMIFTMADQPFVDRRISFDEWPNLKYRECLICNHQTCTKHKTRHSTTPNEIAKETLKCDTILQVTTQHVKYKHSPQHDKT